MQRRWQTTLARPVNGLEKSREGKGALLVLDGEPESGKRRTLIESENENVAILSGSELNAEKSSICDEGDYARIIRSATADVLNGSWRGMSLVLNWLRFSITVGAFVLIATSQYGDRAFHPWTLADSTIQFLVLRAAGIPYRIS